MQRTIPPGQLGHAVSAFTDDLTEIAAHAVAWTLRFCTKHQLMPDLDQHSRHLSLGIATEDGR
jgi:hypothetical protein